MSFKSLKKAIKYRVSYSGTKETDILYKKYFIDDFNKFNENDLIDIQKLFNNYSDNEMYDLGEPVHNYGGGQLYDQFEETSSNITSFSKLDNPEMMIPIPKNSIEIPEEGYKLIRDDAIGEIIMKDLEKEAIIRTLRFFNNNRRKTAMSLGVSERTLYRKIEDYNLEPKIKRNSK